MKYIYLTSILLCIAIPIIKPWPRVTNWDDLEWVEQNHLKIAVQRDDLWKEIDRRMKSLDSAFGKSGDDKNLRITNSIKLINDFNEASCTYSNITVRKPIKK